MMKTQLSRMLTKTLECAKQLAYCLILAADNEHCKMIVFFNKCTHEPTSIDVFLGNISKQSGPELSHFSENMQHGSEHSKSWSKSFTVYRHFVHE